MAQADVEESSVELKEEVETPDEDNLIKVRNLVKFFPITGGLLSKVIGYVHAVDHISFDVPKGKTIGVVGESGCGKTTLGRTILRLVEPTSGEIYFDNHDIPNLPSNQMRHLRRRMQIVFQDPYASLNPRMMVKDILSEPQMVHRRIIQRKFSIPAFVFLLITFLGFIVSLIINQFGSAIDLSLPGVWSFSIPLPSFSPSDLDFLNSSLFPVVIYSSFALFLLFLFLAYSVRKGPSQNQINAYILRILREVGLDKEHLNRFPHEFSGGQRQRICIARALVLNPDFLVLDEPTASVDVSVQARVLNLLKGLQKKRNLTYMFISHDLSVVTHMSDIVMVMYLGKIMEIGPKNIFTLAASKVHPYTSALGGALPVPDPTYSKKAIILKGDVPSPANPPPGCVFHTRCPEAQKICTTDEPELKHKEHGHYIACHFR
ncbi:MAG: ATP-binding cassette domain-containing protein [Candidatus Heimdallarchaeota archaeon]|nr:MAG: ATP-binding cassette domain-containing protein [Candidatus Heimdallarchaeota archaeon]